MSNKINTVSDEQRGQTFNSSNRHDINNSSLSLNIDDPELVVNTLLLL